MSMHSDLMNFIYDEIIKMLAGVTNAPASGAQNVLPLNQWEGAGGLKDIHGDFAFYFAKPRNDDFNKQMDVRIVPTEDPATITRETKYNREFRLDLIFTGDDAYEWADTLRRMLFDPEITADFASQGISLVATVDEADFAPEPVGQQWLQRYDLHADFNQLIISQSSITTVGTADIVIINEDGEETNA